MNDRYCKPLDISGWSLINAINKNSRQHNTPQLKTTLLLYYATSLDCLNIHHQVSICEIKSYKT
jgi:hypothetical protein